MSSNTRAHTGDALAAQINMLTVGRQIRRENEAVLASAEVPIPQEVFLAEKKAPCPHGPLVRPTSLTTNVWQLSQKIMRIHKYYAEFRGIIALRDGRRQIVRFNKRSPDDVVNLHLKDKVLAVFNGLMAKFAAHFEGPVFCDLQNAVYTTSEVPLELLPLEDQHNMHTFAGITPEDVNRPGMFQDNFIEFEVGFKRVHDRFDLELGNVQRLVNNNPESVDRSLVQFLDLATSHYAHMHPEEHVVFPGGNSYLMEPPDHGFSPEDMLLENGRNQFDPLNETYLAIGVQKSVHFVSGPDGTGCCVVVVETKKSPFHMPGPLLEKVVNITGSPRLEDLMTEFGRLDWLTAKFRGTYVVASANDQFNPPGGYKYMKVKRFVPYTARTFPVVFGGQEMFFAQFFLLHYGYNIIRHSAPLVQVSNVNGRIRHYPIELLEVADNQRMKIAMADPLLVRNMIRACAIEPRKLYAQNEQNLEALNLENPDLQALGIGASGPLQVTGSIHSAPELHYAYMEVAVRQGKWTSANAKFFKPSERPKWAAVYIKGQGDRFTMENLEQFSNDFMKMAVQKGMSLDHPRLDEVTVGERAFKEKMSQLACMSVQFILFAHTDTPDKFVHALMKWGETFHGFVTQDTRVKTCLDVIQRGRTQTLQNLVNKANVKLGGLNYTLDRSDPIAARITEDVLYIGLGANHPNGSGTMYSNCVYARDGSEFGDRHHGPPTVIGFSANCTKDPFAFVGDFLFQEAHRDEKVFVIKTIVNRCLEEYYLNREQMPKRIVLFRNGCAEGQFTGILKYEVPLIVHEAKKLADKYACEPAKLTVIVVNKAHNVRFFRNPIPPGSPPEQNIKPGTTVDHTVTSMNQCEFYLSAHTALQGTVKVPRYTVIYDQNNIPSEHLQRLVYWLCHGHQIISLTTSLPAPVNIANEYAKRGRDVYKSATTLGDNDNHGEAGGDLYKRMSHEELNNSLTYWSGEGGLRMSRRVNA